MRGIPGLPSGVDVPGAACPGSENRVVRAASSVEPLYGRAWSRGCVGCGHGGTKTSFGRSSKKAALAALSTEPLRTTMPSCTGFGSAMLTVR